LNARVPKVLTKGVNENRVFRIFIAFGVEGNSGIDCDDLADLTGTSGVERHVASGVRIASSDSIGSPVKSRGLVRSGDEHDPAKGFRFVSENQAGYPIAVDPASRLRMQSTNLSTIIAACLAEIEADIAKGSG
jgi:hypothetical protein